MVTRLTDTTKALLFYLITFGLALGAALLPGTTTGLYMFTPLVAVLLMLLVVTRDGYTRAGWAALGLHRLGWRAWPVAVLVPLLVMSVVYGILWSSGLAQFAVPADIKGIPIKYLPLLIVGGLLADTVTVSLGEELGWRGYLVPRLATLGPWRAALLSGLLHGIWHLPLMLLTTQYHPDGSRAIVIPLFLLTLMVAGVFFAYLRFATDSVWPAALAHTAHNMFWLIFAAFTGASSPLVVEYLAGDSGLLIAVGYALAAGWLMFSLTRRVRNVPRAHERTPELSARP